MNNPADDPRPWKLVSHRPGPDLKVFRSRIESRLNPRNGHRLDCLVLDSRDWVNVVALTQENKAVLVKQFRFGSGSVTVEIPGGVIDPNEGHGAAARRELREETGFAAKRWTYLGATQPNPAILNNLCHHWLAEEAELAHETSPDEGEDITVITAGIDEIRAAIVSGRLRHALAIAGLAKVFDLRPEPPLAGAALCR